MKNIVWKRAATGDYDTTQYAEIHGGALWVGANCFELCFVPDPRIALAGQIAAGLAIVPNSGIISNTGEAVANIAEISLKLADEILRQAGEKQITAGN